MIRLTRVGPPEYADLVEALLPPFKAYARIDHDDDDDGLKLILSETVALLERQFGVAIAPQVWAWQLDGTTATSANRLACACDGLPASAIVPIRGVNDWRASRGTPPVDVTAEYSMAGNLYWADFSPLALERAGGIVGGDTLELIAGMPEGGSLSPGLFNLVFRYGLFLWENRESGGAQDLTEAPDWLLRVWSTYWTPRL